MYISISRSDKVKKIKVVLDVDDNKFDEKIDLHLGLGFISLTIKEAQMLKSELSKVLKDIRLKYFKISVDKG